MLCAIIVVLLVFFLTTGLTYTLRRALMKLKVPEGQTVRLLRWVFFSLLIWGIMTALLSFGGYYSNFRYFPPRVLLFGIVPPVLLALYLIFNKTFVALLSVVPPSWLMFVQSFRIVMELMLFLAFWYDIFPFQMTFIGFNLDIVAGLTALLAAKVFYGKRRYFRMESVIWNLFGILLLLTIVFITAVSTPTAYRIFMNEPSSAAIVDFPFIWIPTFIVPYALAMHIFSIRQAFIKEIKPFESTYGI